MSAPRARIAAALALALALGPAPASAAVAGAEAPHLPAASATAAGAPRDRDGFRLAVPPWSFRFPQDHAAHPQFRTEWWYYTGHLAGGGRTYGYEQTFFRIGLPARRPAGGSAWSPRDLVFEHLALTDESRGRFRHAEAGRRAVLGMAGADSSRYDVRLGDDRASLAPDGRTHRLRGAAPDFALDLVLEPLKAPVPHGARGVSQKTAGPGQASHYYSITRMATHGTLVDGADTLAVTGTSWMDHEFGSSRMAATHAGWDWFGVQLDDGRELMFYRLRLRDGRIEPFSHGTLVARDGGTRPLALADVRVRASGTWRSPHTQAVYPSGWTLEVPGEGLVLELEPTVRDQELVAASMGGVAYWEGSVRVRGTSRGARIGGQGYVELTGYGGRAPF